MNRAAEACHRSKVTKYSGGIQARTQLKHVTGQRLPSIAEAYKQEQSCGMS